MKKKTISICTIFLLIVSLLTIAASARYEIVSSKKAILSFNGSTAVCGLIVRTTDDSAEITATVKLQKKGLFGIYSTLKTWNDVTGTGELDFSETYSPVSSGDYRLTADVEATSKSGSDSFTVSTTASAANVEDP